ncbi:MAG: hypothetical protein KAR13_05455, partial [Desulfobulbaceae bacterium]|nr:hypothetical protein [Desulfobulbaceae bacterium]
IHHIVSDGWSMSVLYRELGELYKAFSTSKTSPLTELPFQYVDFAACQRKWMSGPVLEKQLSYWKEKLTDLPTLNLPTDFIRPRMQTFEGSREILTLPKEWSGILEGISRKEGGTLFMTLFAAFTVFLHRYTGQNDLAVGTPIANRNRADIEGLIGFFVNPLILRTDLTGNPGFLELLTRVKETAFGAYQHQDVPFESLVEELEPERDLSRNPLFQVLFAMQNLPMSSLELGDLTLSILKTEAVTTRFDLEVHVWQESEGLSVWFIYNTALFTAETIQRMVGHFRNLLKGIIADPLTRISDLPLMNEEEKRQIVYEWNQTSEVYPQDKVIHGLFEEQVERTPDAVAVIHEDTQI